MISCHATLFWRGWYDLPPGTPILLLLDLARGRPPFLANWNSTSSEPSSSTCTPFFPHVRGLKEASTRFRTMSGKPQVILVVGGTSGIGYSITQSLLSSPYLPLNAKVIAFGLIDSTIKLEFTKQQRERLRIVEGDVTVDEDRELAMRTCFNVFGGLDTLVYCAGIITPIQTFGKLNIEAVKRSFDVNVFGAMSMVRNSFPSKPV